MDKNQALTLAAYNHFPERYVAGTSHKLHPEITRWMDIFLSKLQPGANILEVGCAMSRDADYMESKGFRVIRTDAAQGFIDYLASKGITAKLFNPLIRPYAKKYDAVFAAAVLLHFNTAQLEKVLDNLGQQLAPKGYFCFWVKRGVGEEYSSHKMDAPRYFKYWESDQLSEVLVKNGFDIVELEYGGELKWLMYIVRRSN